MPITTNVVSLNPAHGEMYSIHHYAIKFVSDLRQVGGLTMMAPKWMNFDVCLQFVYTWYTDI
jgi:hypothetical protein